MAMPYCGQVDTRDIIDYLRRVEQFNEFYCKKFQPIESKIVLKTWIFPELANEGYYAMCGVDRETGAEMIWLQSLPTSITDVYLVAHELGHIVRKAEGLSLYITELRDEYINVAGYIKSVLEDRVIDSMLMDEFKFNPIPHYVDAMRTFEQHKSSMAVTTDIDKKEQSLIYADYLLRWSLIDNANFKDRFDKYKRDFNREFSYIAKDGEEIAANALRIGFDTLDAQAQIFTYISNKYLLSDALII